MKTGLAALAAVVLFCAGCAGTGSQGGLSGVIAPEVKLELVREGLLDLRQDRAFAPIWVRRHVEQPQPPAPTTEPPEEQAA